ncbi:MAG: CTP synthase C-terminal region-related (seleno)protein [Rubrobacteraceae bacterium]
MRKTIRVGIIGDHDPDKLSNTATDAALEHATRFLGASVTAEWLPTKLLERSAPEKVECFGAFWCAPGSPYKSMSGAIEMIRAVRESGKPFIATCGGFQHVAIEYARNVLGLPGATHAEYDPDAPNPFITPLSCSLAGQSARVELSPDSRVREFYGEPEADEEYLCNFGLAPIYRGLIEEGGLRVSGVDRNSEARVVELPGHDFYVATLFVPQMRSSAGRPHPLVVAFLRAALAVRSGRRSPRLEDAR